MFWMRLSGIVGLAWSRLYADVGSIPGVAREADGKGARGRGRAGALRCPEDAEAGRFIKDEQRKKRKKEQERKGGRDRGRERERKRDGETKTGPWLVGPCSVVISAVVLVCRE